MSSATLKKITTRAKQLRKKRPGISWKTAVKSAGLEYRQGKMGKTRKARPAKKKKAVKRKRMGSGGQVTRSRTHTDYNRNKVNIAVGSVSHHMGAAKKMLLEDIGKKEAQKFAATKKSVRNKIQRGITELKRRYRKVAC